MARYRLITPGPSDGYPHARARWIAEQSGAIVYRRPDNVVVESRGVWPDNVSQETLSETPDNPILQGWVRLTSNP